MISIDLIWPPNRVVNWVSVRPLVSGTTIATKNTPTIKTMAWNPNKCERPKECSIQGYIFRIRATTMCLTLRLTEHPTVRPLKSKRSGHATSFIHSKLFWVQWPKSNLLQIETFKELTFTLEETVQKTRYKQLDQILLHSKMKMRPLPRVRVSVCVKEL